MTTAVTARRITPTGRLVLPADAPRDQWLAERRKRIGSSDAPKILGLYGSALSVWYDKRGELPEQDQNDAMLFGTLFEDTVAQEWARRNRSVVRRVGLVEHVDEPYLACTLDRRVTECPLREGQREACGLEVKCRNAFGSGNWGNSGVPDDVLAQVLEQILVTGYSHMHVAVLIGGNDYRQRTVYADREADTLAYVAAELRRFYHDHVATGVPPRPDGGGEDLIDLDNRLYPHRTGVAELDREQAVDAMALRERYAEAHEQMVTAEKRKKVIQAELIGLLNGREIAVADDRFLYSYEVKAGAPRVDLDRLAEHHPDVYAECVTPTSHRTFNAGLGRRKGK